MYISVKAVCLLVFLFYGSLLSIHGIDIPVSKVKFSQTGISSKTSEGQTLGDLATSMKTGGFRKDSPLDVVQTKPNTFITLDNRRLAAATVADLNTVPANVHQPQDKLSAGQVRRFTSDAQRAGQPPPKNFGNVVRNRMRTGSIDGDKITPNVFQSGYQNQDVRIRAKPTLELVPFQKAGFIVSDIKVPRVPYKVTPLPPLKPLTEGDFPALQSSSNVKTTNSVWGKGLSQSTPGGLNTLGQNASPSSSRRNSGVGLPGSSITKSNTQWANLFSKPGSVVQKNPATQQVPSSSKPLQSNKNAAGTGTRGLSKSTPGGLNILSQNSSPTTSRRGSISGITSPELQKSGISRSSGLLSKTLSLNKGVRNSGGTSSSTKLGQNASPNLSRRNSFSGTGSLGSLNIGQNPSSPNLSRRNSFSGTGSLGSLNIGQNPSSPNLSRRSSFSGSGSPGLQLNTNLYSKLGSTQQVSSTATKPKQSYASIAGTNSRGSSSLSKSTPGGLNYLGRGNTNNTPFKSPTLSNLSGTGVNNFASSSTSTSGQNVKTRGQKNTRPSSTSFGRGSRRS